MEQPRYYDVAGRINYEALALYATQLRREAIDAFFTELSSTAAHWFEHLRRSDAHAGTRVPAPTLTQARHRSG